MELSWNKYVPVKDSTVITTLDAHAAGEPLRIEVIADAEIDAVDEKTASIVVEALNLL